MLVHESRRVVARRQNLVLTTTSSSRSTEDTTSHVFRPPGLVTPGEDVIDLSKVMNSDMVDLEPVYSQDDAGVGPYYIVDARTGRALGVDHAHSGALMWVLHVHDWARFPAFALSWHLKRGEHYAALELADKLGMYDVLVKVLQEQGGAGGDILWLALVKAERLDEASAVLLDMARREHGGGRRAYEGLAAMTSALS
jgi:hypothetical protein